MNAAGIHDEIKMARAEPCTFKSIGDDSGGWREPPPLCMTTAEAQHMESAHPDLLSLTMPLHDTNTLATLGLVKPIDLHSGGLSVNKFHNAEPASEFADLNPEKLLTRLPNQELGLVPAPQAIAAVAPKPPVP